MVYKDKEKQKEASKEAMRRYRVAEKARREREQGITPEAENVIPEQSVIPSDVIPNFGQPDCECKHCQQRLGVLAEQYRIIKGIDTMSEAEPKSPWQTYTQLCDRTEGETVIKKMEPCSFDVTDKGITIRTADANLKPVVTFGKGSK